MHVGEDGVQNCRAADNVSHSYVPARTAGDANRSEQDVDRFSRQAAAPLNMAGPGSDDDNPQSPEWAVASQPAGVQLSHDIWKQLKKVTILVISGDKKHFESWKSAFTVCVDKAPATKEYRLLQMCQDLSGAAIKAIDGLGHLVAVFNAAKARLDRKYGENQHQVALFIEELDQFKPIRPGNAKDVDKLEICWIPSS